MKPRKLLILLLALLIGLSALPAAFADGEAGAEVVLGNDSSADDETDSHLVNPEADEGDTDAFRRDSGDGGRERRESLESPAMRVQGSITTFGDTVPSIVTPEGDAKAVAEAWVREILGDDIDFVEDSVSLKCVSLTQAGIFSNTTGMFLLPGKTADDAIDLKAGIVLSTGVASRLFGSSLSTSAIKNGKDTTTADADLNNLVSSSYGSVAYETVVLEFQVVATGTELFFNYAFVSTEFNQGEQFNDVFGLFVKEGTGDFANIAYISDGVPVTIQDLKSAGSDYCHYNSNGSALEGLGYNGYSKVFTCKQTVTPGSVVTIKMAIGDVSDGSFDSAIFIEAGSLGFTAPEVPQVVDLDDQGCAPVGRDISIVPSANGTLYILDADNIPTEGGDAAIMAAAELPPITEAEKGVEILAETGSLPVGAYVVYMLDDATGLLSRQGATFYLSDYFTLTLVSNGGTPVASRRLWNGHEVSAKPATYYIDNYIEGWYSSPDGVLYTFPFIMPAHDLTLVAEWLPVEAAAATTNNDPDHTDEITIADGTAAELRATISPNRPPDVPGGVFRHVWYEGDPADLSAAVAVSDMRADGAFLSSALSAGTHTFFCRVHTVVDGNLSAGVLSNKVTVTVESASKNAIDRIEVSGTPKLGYIEGQ